MGFLRFSAYLKSFLLPGYDFLNYKKKRLPHPVYIPQDSFSSSEDKAVDEITLDGMVSDALSKMTLKEKIGQLFVVCTDSLDFNAETEVTALLFYSSSFCLLR